MTHNLYKHCYYCMRRIFHKLRYKIDIISSKLFFKENATIWHNMSAVKNNLCVFSHFDPHNIIDAYVVYYLSELAKCDCDIIFVTTCDNLPIEEIAKINPLCKRIIVKKNRGLDFGAYKCGIATEANLHQYQKLILANDSVYGPFFDLKNIINYGDKKNLGMWGATDSHMIKYHIQGYFVVFSQQVFLSHLFKKFWDNVYYLILKNNIIVQYEIGMSQYFLNHGFMLGAFCACPMLANHIRHDPSHHSWHSLITKEQYPFIKRMLIRNNPHQVNIDEWHNTIDNLRSFDTQLITQHLERTTCPR